MSKKIYLFSLVLLALAFTACSETETVDKYDNWRSRNESFIDSLANVFEAGTDPLLLRIKVEQGNDYIYYLKSASNLNGNLNCSKELEHYAS